MNKLLPLIIIIIMVPMVLGTAWCGMETNVDTLCEEQTAILGTCTNFTVDTYPPNHTISETKQLTQIATTGTYYFNFTSSAEGVHKWIACDNSTGTINVGATLIPTVNNTAIANAVWDTNITAYADNSLIDQAGHFLYWLYSTIF